MYFTLKLFIDSLNLYKKSIKALSVLFFVSKYSMSPLSSGDSNSFMFPSTFNAIDKRICSQYDSFLK